MPTRFYLPASSPASESTAPDAGWNYTSEVSRHNLSATKGSSAITAGTLIGPLSGTATHKGVDRMWFSPELGAQTISGSISMMLMTREGAGTDNIDRPWMAVFVVRAGTKVATLRALAVQTGAATTEWVANASHRTCTFANAAALTSFACNAGDKILVEIGGGNNAGGTTPEFSCKYGENATDATLGDNATTADRAGWIEFSASLAMNPVPIVAGAMTTTATSTSATTALLGLLMTAMTSIASSVTSILTLLGILTGSQTTQSTSTTSTTTSVEESSTPIETGAMLSSGTSTTITEALVGVVAEAATSTTLSSATTTHQLGLLGGATASTALSGMAITTQMGILAGAMTSVGSGSTVMGSTVETVNGEENERPSKDDRSMGMGMGMRL